MLKLKQMALAVTLALPMLANAQTNAELKSEIDLLKAQINELKAMMQQQVAAPAAAPAGGGEAVDPAEFAVVRTKLDALIDDKEAAGFKGLRISGGIDPTYIYNRAKDSSSFGFLNNFSSVNGSGEVYSYDNSYQGIAYLDVQKEMDDGTKFRLTLSPSKSTGAQYNWGSIVHEASASIPLGDKQTRLLVGQMPDLSGYEPFLNTYAGANALWANLLYPGYAESFITKNLLFDFTAATFYTGVGLNLVRGPWTTNFFLANFNSARNDVNMCPSATQTDTTVTPVVLGANVPCDPRPVRSPVFVYNATYFIPQAEFWYYEFTGYEGKVTNWVKGGTSRLDQFEIDGNYTHGEFSGNLQFTVGRQKDAAISGNGDAKWWGISSMAAQRVTPQLTLAGRFDYLYNEKNGGGTFNVGNLIPNTIDVGNGSGNGIPYAGDFYNGFGPGDPNAADYDPNKGANRYGLTLSATYRLSPYVAFRGELRHDHATTASFYDFKNQTFKKSNDLFGLQTIVNF